jgi:polysaccharide pyruvyl transferase WcaK-like protein
LKRIVIWGAWYGSHNVGDQVLLLTITDILARTIGTAPGRAYSGASGEVSFTVLTDDADHVRAYTSQASRYSIQAVRSRREFPRVVNALATSDLLVFGGGVPFFEESKHLWVMATIVGLARIFRTPYMTWTVSSQDVHSALAKRLFKWVLDGAQAITYRDEHTLELFKSCGVNRPMYLAGDSGFWLEPEEDGLAIEIIAGAGQRDASRPLVALTPRTLRGPNGDAELHYNVKTPAQFEQEIDCFVAALDWLWENGYQPIFVPMNTVAPDDDRIACCIVKDRARHGQSALLIDQAIRPRLAPAIYKQCHASFVARVHGSITSMVAGCPMMMYAFAPKHAGIMEAMNLSQYSLVEANATPQSTIGLLANLVANRQSLQCSMEQRLVELRQAAMIPAQFAAEILAKAPS